MTDTADAYNPLAGALSADQVDALVNAAEGLTENQQTRLEELFDHEQHVEFEATWGSYQQMITAYRELDRGSARSSCSPSSTPSSTVSRPCSSRSAAPAAP